MDQVFHDSEESSSSGCESGWTLYLDDHSITIHDSSFQNKHNDDDHYDDDGIQDDEDDDDNMSMVSDASSGPPHLHEHQEHDEDEEKTMINAVFCDPVLDFESRKRRKILKQKSFYELQQLQDLPAASLDDTASSPFFSFSNKDIEVCNREGLIEDDNSFDYSQGHSATYFEMV